MFAHRVARAFGPIHVGPAALPAGDAPALLQTIEQRHDRGIRQRALFRDRFPNVMNRAFAQPPQGLQAGQFERRRQAARCGFSSQELLPVTLAPSAPFSLSANAEAGSEPRAAGFAAGGSITGSGIASRYLRFFSAARSSAEL